VLNRNLPHWLSLGLLASIVVGVLAAYGWIKPYLNGPDLALSTIYRPKPVPVKVETVQWMNDVRVVRERVAVPGGVEVVHDIPPKVAKRLVDDFHISLPDLQKEHRELVDVLDVPKAPHGGEMALTINTETGNVNGIFRPKPAPFIELGGIREAGAAFDPLNKAVTVSYRQDLARVGPIVISGRAFVTGPITPGRAPSYGVEIGGSFRF
jgi:hypothetical protein